jgi:hypothetical protein
LPTNSLWAISCFFNPAGYRRRYQNYVTFRQNLNVPLVAIELSYNGLFELRPGDAESIVQLRGSDILWQKERLLNVALSHLPSECRQVAWLDCDIVFENKDWAAATVDVLEQKTLCQPFRLLHHLAPDVPIDRQYAIETDRSLAYGLASGETPYARTPPGARPRWFKQGNAWAANRSLLERTGFYDRAIVGGGDKLMAFAAMGLSEKVNAYFLLSPAHAEDYYAWARTFNEEAEGQIGYVETDCFHLWHGDLKNRQYEERHAILRENHYDPAADISLDPQGCWRWNSPKYEMHRRIRDYFYERWEDGTALSQRAG